MLLALAAALAVAAPAPEGLPPKQLARLQAALQKDGLDGWLFYDFRGSDPIAARVLGLDPRGAHTRRWYCLVPATGEPRRLVHAIEPHALDGVPGSFASYTSWRSRDAALAALLRGMRRIAMEYTPRGELPTLGLVDGGTLELVRSLGPEVVSSAALVAEVESVLTPEELESQRVAAELLAADEDAVAAEAVRRIRSGQPATEGELRQFALERWKREGLDEGWPGVSVGPNTANPHYAAPEQGSARAERGSLLLLDFAARRGTGPHSIYGDLTKVYFLGERVPDEVARVAAAVFAARDAALKLVQDGAREGKLPTGAEVDRAASAVIERAGFGAGILHRTGHNIGVRGHGDGVNNDDFETHDVRRHLPDTCFSIEPGIYLPGRFGIRSEIDVCFAGKPLRAEVRGGVQRELPALLAPGR